MGIVSDVKILNALLFDTRSIQKYIFSGNRLSTNIGASFIVDKVFTKILVGEVLTKFFPQENFSTADTVWNPAEDNIETWADMKNCAIAYIGGGNALILFKQDGIDVRKKIVEEFTRKLLAKRPGLKVGAAHGELDSGINFYGKIVLLGGDEKILTLLALALKNLSSAGTKRNRGFGKIKCSIDFGEGKDENFYIEKWRKENA